MSLSSPTAGSTSRGTAISRRQSGRPRRALRTCVSRSSVNTGRCAPVDAITMSAATSAPRRFSQSATSAPNCFAISSARARADEMAKQFGADVADWENLRGALVAADIVIASTGAQRPVLTLDLLTQVRKARRGRPLCLLDIAVPRDVEPAVGELSDIYLYDIDALQKVAGEHRAERAEEAAEAESVVEEELGRFVKKWRNRQRGPMISALQTHFHGIARAEVMRLSGGVDEKERKARLDIAESLVKKLLHQPMTALRDDDPDAAMSLVQALQRLFSLSPVAAVPAREDAADAST